MSDVDALVELEALLGKLPAAIESRRLGDGLTKAKNKLHDSDRLVDRIEALLELANEIGLDETNPHSEMIEEVRFSALDVGKNLESAGTAADLDKAISRYERELTTEVTQLKRGVSQHWRSVIERQFTPMLSVGTLLDRINPVSDLGKQLNACATEARSTSDSLDGRALLDHVRRLLQLRERLQARRRDELGDGDVADFVNALAEDRATLAMVTPSVRSWLNENDALDRLKVKPGA